MQEVTTPSLKFESQRRFETTNNKLPPCNSQVITELRSWDTIRSLKYDHAIYLNPGWILRWSAYPHWSPAEETWGTNCFDVILNQWDETNYLSMVNCSLFFCAPRTSNRLRNTGGELCWLGELDESKNDINIAPHWQRLSKEKACHLHAVVAHMLIYVMLGCQCGWFEFS